MKFFVYLLLLCPALLFAQNKQHVDYVKESRAIIEYVQKTHPLTTDQTKQLMDYLPTYLTMVDQVDIALKSGDQKLADQYANRKQILEEKFVQMWGDVVSTAALVAVDKFAQKEVNKD